MTITVQPLALWQSELIASLPGVVHGVTRRVRGLGRADGNVGFSAPRDREDAWHMRQHWCESAGLSAERLVTLGQIHGAEIHIATASHAGWGARPGSTQIGYGDGLATNIAGPVLMTLHADCQPLIFVDPGRQPASPGCRRCPCWLARHRRRYSRLDAGHDGLSLRFPGRRRARRPGTGDWRLLL